jgi:hypothetical protein
MKPKIRLPASKLFRLSNRVGDDSLSKRSGGMCAERPFCNFQTMERERSID